MHHRTSRIEVLRQIHGSIERAKRELHGRPRAAPGAAGRAHLTQLALDELGTQQRFVSNLLAASGDPRALLGR